MFHDLSLGVVETDGNTRRGLVSTALQLSYTSVATGRVHSGPLADSDRSSSKPLDISSVLSAASGIAESVKFHQKLLGVPAEQPFRQYSRITVVVDDPVQSSALNSGNQVLRSYDIVAVRPTNQRAFEQACKNSERGLFFEISYGRALFDARARKELFANAQVLQTVTKGHGIVISSGAFQSVELRGPNDVANMATLFGLSVEAAKVAVSKNCQSVILHGVARKKVYKAAIVVERVPAVSEGFLFAVPSVWDPLSVGMAKGSTVKLGPLLDAADKRDSTNGSLSRTEVDEVTKKPSLVLKSNVANSSDLSSKDKEETFIPMVNLTSEWTQVSKRGKKSKDKRTKTLQLNKDSKKRKFN